MLKNLLKTTLFFLLGLQTLFAAAVNDGFEQYKKGNNEQAIEIFKKACDGGYAQGCKNLGVSYYDGKGVVKDLSKGKIK